MVFEVPEYEGEYWFDGVRVTVEEFDVVTLAQEETNFYGANEFVLGEYDAHVEVRYDGGMFPAELDLSDTPFKLLAIDAEGGEVVVKLAYEG